MAEICGVKIHHYIINRYPATTSRNKSDYCSTPQKYHPISNSNCTHCHNKKKDNLLAPFERFPNNCMEIWKQMLRRAASVPFSMSNPSNNKNNNLKHSYSPLKETDEEEIGTPTSQSMPTQSNKNPFSFQDVDLSLVKPFLSKGPTKEAQIAQVVDTKTQLISFIKIFSFIDAILLIFFTFVILGG